jgi:ribonuclease HI
MNKIVAYCDGGCRGNPGESAIGVVFLYENGVRYDYCESIGVTTNNVAEYRALLFAVTHAVISKADILHVYSDSELMVKQVKGLYTVRSPELKKIYDQIIMQLPHLQEFRIQHIRREFNTEADALVNECLDEGKNGNISTKKGR